MEGGDSQRIPCSHARSSKEDLPTFGGISTFHPLQRRARGTSDGPARPPCRTYSLGKSLTWRTARGWGGVSRGQALHHDHLQSSEIPGGDWTVCRGAVRSHGIDTFPPKCGNSREDGGPCCPSHANHNPHGALEEDLPTVREDQGRQGRASRSPMSNLLFREESDMEDSEGVGRGVEWAGSPPRPSSVLRNRAGRLDVFLGGQCVPWN